MTPSARLALAALCVVLVRPDPVSATLRVEAWETYVLTEHSPCTGEAFEAQVKVHVVGTETVTPTGSTLSGLHINSVWGMGTSASGQRYLLRDGSNTRAVNAFLDPIGTAQVWIATGRIRVLALGRGGDDYEGHYVVHVTWTPDGRLIVDLERTRTACR